MYIYKGSQLNLADLFTCTSIANKTQTLFCDSSETSRKGGLVSVARGWVFGNRVIPRMSLWARLTTCNYSLSFSYCHYMYIYHPHIFNPVQSAIALNAFASLVSLHKSSNFTTFNVIFSPWSLNPVNFPCQSFSVSSFTLCTYA